MSSTSVTDSVFDMDWSYQGGSGDLREVKREARKQAKEQYAKDELEAMIDTVIDRVLGKDPPKTEDVVVDQAEGIESCKGEEELRETLSEDTDKKEDMAAIVDMMANANIAIGQSGVVNFPTVVMETAAKEDSICVEENPGASEDKESVEPESMEALADMTAQANIIIGESGLVDISNVVMETAAKEDSNCVEENPGPSEDKEVVEPKSMEALADMTAQANIIIGESGLVDISTIVMETAAKEDSNCVEENPGPSK